MQTYVCHKEVQASRIAGIHLGSAGGATLFPAEKGNEPFEVSQGYLDKHNPQRGGYYVRYKDGYESYSPADAFEGGYNPKAEPRGPVVFK